MNKEKSGIYFIINLMDGKIYVGQTIMLKTRLRGHLTHLMRGAHCNPHLQAAFNRDGAENFYLYIAEECQPSMLVEREQYWIDYFDRDRRYNIAPVAASCRGIRRSDEYREKASKAKLGKPRPAHVGEAVALANSKRKICDKTREQMRARLLAANLGKEMSEGHKKKISEARLSYLTAFGETRRIDEWSERFGVSRSLITKRLSLGWAIEDAVSRKTGKYKRAPAAADSRC